MRTGADRLLAGEFTRALAGKRVAFLGNQTAVASNLAPVSAWLAAHCKLERLLGPEHGYWGVAQDMEAVADAVDPITRAPIVSLYGDEAHSLTPQAKSLDGIDVIVFDIADVGARYYTYVWTLAYTYKVAASLGIETWVLDRPNPLGRTIEGGAIEPGFESFIGAYTVPNRHGMTVGELTRMVADLEGIDGGLQIVECQGWDTSTYTPFVGDIAPSPNMPRLESAIVYPGGCLIEATEISEGRGTTRPFEWLGAPYIDAADLAQTLTQLELPGVVFRPTYFKPTFQKHAHVVCGGVQVHVTDRALFLPYKTGVAFLWAVNSLYPDAFAWRHAPYEFVDDIPAVDLLYGSPRLRQGLENGADLETLAADWADYEQTFAQTRVPWLLY